MSVVIDQEYLDTLRAFGDVDEQINSAVEEYVTRRIVECIKHAREHLAEFEHKYRMEFADFSTRVVLDEALYLNTRKQNPLWEQDLQAWDYWDKESTEWKNRLNSILSKS